MSRRKGGKKRNRQFPHLEDEYTAEQWRQLNVFMECFPHIIEVLEDVQQNWSKHLDWLVSEHLYNNEYCVDDINDDLARINDIMRKIKYPTNRKSKNKLHSQYDSSIHYVNTKTDSNKSKVFIEEVSDGKL